MARIYLDLATDSGILKYVEVVRKLDTLRPNSSCEIAQSFHTSNSTKSFSSLVPGDAPYTQADECSWPNRNIECLKQKEILQRLSIGL